MNRENDLLSGGVDDDIENNKKNPTLSEAYEYEMD